MFIKDKCPISATPSGSDVMYHIFFYKCLMPLASGCKTVLLLNSRYAKYFFSKISGSILFNVSVFSDVPCRNSSFCKNIVWQSENCLKSGAADEYFSRADGIFKQKL